MIKKALYVIGFVLLFLLFLIPIEGCNGCNNNWLALYISFIANVLFLLAGILLPWLGWNFFNHKKVMSFFKPLSGNKIVVAISLPEMAENNGQKIPMVSFAEMKCAYEFAEIFTYRIRQYGDPPQGLLARTIISPFDFEVIFASQDLQKIPDSNFNISLGSPLYNNHSKWIEENLAPAIKTKSSADGVSFSYSGSPIYNELSHAFIQRIIKDDRVFFYLAGNSDFATTGAVLHLKKNWSAWVANQDKSFAVILSVRQDNPCIASEIVPLLLN